MFPLIRWPLTDRQRIKGVFTDIDDTLTTDGAITPDALAALHDLKVAGLKVIAITGRPVGWSEPFARDWPVDAIVAENGSVLLRAVRAEPFDGLRTGLVEASSTSTNPSTLRQTQDRTSSGRTVLSKMYQQDAPTRASNYARMQQVAARVVREVPGAVLSEDSPGRETDMAIDHSEFAHLSPSAIAQAVQIMQSEGMNATVSSIHINGWFGAHNKLEGARWIARELLGRSLDAEMAHWVYVGDSTNDQLMFEAFPNSVGVANIRRFEAELSHQPRYITESERGAGFAEVAAAIIASKFVR